MKKQSNRKVKKDGIKGESGFRNIRDDWKSSVKTPR